jgi:hypothetical protein
MKLSLYVGETRDLERSLEAIVADEIVFWPFPAGHDQAASLAATLDAMQALAAR